MLPVLLNWLFLFLFLFLNDHLPPTILSISVALYGYKNCWQPFLSIFIVRITLKDTSLDLIRSAVILPVDTRQVGKQLDVMSEKIITNSDYIGNIGKNFAKIYSIFQKLDSLTYNKIPELV